MTLAPLFAQVRGCLDESERVLNAAWEVKPAIRALPADLEAAISALDVEDALAALSSIERHVRDMETALGAIPGKPPYRVAGIPAGIISADDWDATDEVLAFLAALPAREKEEE